MIAEYSYRADFRALFVMSGTSNSQCPGLSWLLHHRWNAHRNLHRLQGADNGTSNAVSSPLFPHKLIDRFLSWVITFAC
jgi:hypothetical protein